LTIFNTKSPSPQPIKRNYPRAQLAIRVQYGGPNGRLKEGFTSILGGGGLFVETVHPLPVGSQLVLELVLSTQPEPIRIMGKVVWVRPEFGPKGVAPGMGIQFDQILEKDRQNIISLVTNLLMGRPETGM
jgi:uncharacterized protein (TIGR02266 family)